MIKCCNIRFNKKEHLPHQTPCSSPAVSWLQCHTPSVDLWLKQYFYNGVMVLEEEKEILLSQSDNIERKKRCLTLNRIWLIDNKLIDNNASYITEKQHTTSMHNLIALILQGRTRNKYKRNFDLSEKLDTIKLSHYGFSHVFIIYW